MAMSKNLGMYSGIKKTLDQIISNGHECTLSFATTTQLKSWRQRAYYYRRLLHEKQAEDLNMQNRPVSTATPYDEMIFRVATDKNDKPIPTKLIVTVGDSPLDMTFDETSEPIFTADVNEAPPMSDEQIAAELAELLKDPE